MQITGASNLTQADVDAVVAAIDVMEGGSGVAPLVKLSSLVAATDIEAVNLITNNNKIPLRRGLF